MKNLLCLLILSLSLFTYAQEKLILDGIIVLINKNNIIVDVPEYKGKILVVYQKLNDKYIYEGEYENMNGFQDKRSLSSGDYIIEVTRDNKKKKSAKFRIN